MSEVVIKVKKIDGKNQAISLPQRATQGSAGFDLMASNDEEIVIAPGERALIPTGIAIELPQGLEAQIRPRSGLAWKYGITLLNTPGTIDSDYRGEIKIIMINLGKEPFRLKKGDRIAQMVISRFVECKLEEVKELTETERSSGGFGHTGI
jgi:dUTP pyrophosphatase